MKQEFLENLRQFVRSLNAYVSTEDGQWTIKGFIDVYKNVYTISSDTKIVSKILEIHLFPKILEFAEQHGLAVVPAEHQNYYPDISFVSTSDERVKFAVDFKTTYKLSNYPGFCNGFTLGSHGEYFINRESTKNIQFPYKDYLGHFCLGIIYSRAVNRDIDDIKVYELSNLRSITSVIKNFEFFVEEKWRIASDKNGSGNTANIGSITKIDDILNGNGMFCRLGEPWFDDYWMNYGKITITTPEGKTRKITSLVDFVKYRGGDVSLVTPKSQRYKREK
jgi:hypothetical protein